MAAVSSLLLRHFFFFFLITFVDSQCLDDQKKLLVDLKSELIFNSSESLHLMKWNETDDDCCQWGSVGCDAAGHVISLDLFKEGISGGIGESSSLFRFTFLRELVLSSNHFTTTHIPRSIHRLSNLTRLDLSNSGLMGPIPSTLANLTHLLHLDLSWNSLTGSIPSTLSNLTHLVVLDLSVNSLTGSIPSFHSCNKLEQVQLGTNNLMGSISHLHFEALTKLSDLDLSNNSLNGTIPHHLFALPSIRTLDLSENQFNGQIKEFPISNHSNLDMLGLSSNRIEGPLPDFFFQFPSLASLRLFDNMFDGTFKLQKIQNLSSLELLDLSYNKLSVETANMNSSSGGFPNVYRLYLSSCNIYDFPDLRNISYIWVLDLSNNHIAGVIPSWIWDMGIRELNLSLNLLTDFQKPCHITYDLMVLDLHSNQLHGEFPLLQPLLNDMFFYFFLSNNSLTGVIPASICNVSGTMVLDFSFNNLNGTIPPCLLENSSLQVLNLRGNNIDGVIPDQISSYCELITFDVSDNNLVGKIPKSLANCKDLVVMNVGNNNLDDSFPCMLSSSLHVLILRSNRFHGDLSCQNRWPNLQILDISSNNFTGTVDPLNLSSWKGMMLENPSHIRPNRSSSNFLSPISLYRDEVTITVKGIEVMLVKIWPDFTSIDLSCNNFEGEIPNAIGSLTSLYLLNLSHNALTSAIPKSLGALTELGSLDLSANHLTGRIPEQLVQLTFLSVLNVSHNQLIGKIPTGPQFQTFSSDSFEGNTGLCGFPLNTSCTNPPQGSGVTPSKSKDEEIEWEYVFAAVGYVVGLGSIAWTLLCCRSLRERYFEKIEEVVDNIFYKRARRRRHERRIERRNEVIRRRRERA